jgi:hypothetical protein
MELLGLCVGDVTSALQVIHLAGTAAPYCRSLIHSLAVRMCFCLPVRLPTFKTLSINTASGTSTLATKAIPQPALNANSSCTSRPAYLCMQQWTSMPQQGWSLPQDTSGMLHWGQQQQLLQCCIHPLGMGPLVLAYPYSNQQAHLHLWQGNAGTHRIRLQLTSKIGSLGRFQGLFLTCMCLHSYTHVLSLQAKTDTQLAGCV